MSDITANLVIGMPAQLFTLARSFKANANGKIYIGQPDTDPTNPANQIQVYVEDEDGSPVPVPQPIIINAGGFPVLGGQIKRFVTVQNYSMAIYDAYNAQQFYFEDVAKYDPDRLRADLAKPTGASLVGIGNGRTQQDKNQEFRTILDYPGSSSLERATAMIAGLGYVRLANGEHVFTTGTLDAPLYFDYGAYITIPAGNTLTITGNIESPKQYIFRGDGSVLLRNDEDSGEDSHDVHASWFGVVPVNDAAIDQAPALAKLFASLDNTREGSVDFDSGRYPIGFGLIVPRATWIRCLGSRRTIFEALGNGYDLFTAQANGVRFSGMQFELSDNFPTTFRSSGWFINSNQQLVELDDVWVGKASNSILLSGGKSTAKQIRATFDEGVDVGANSCVICVEGSDALVEDVMVVGDGLGPAAIVSVGGQGVNNITSATVTGVRSNCKSIPVSITAKSKKISGVKVNDINCRGLTGFEAPAVVNIETTGTGSVDGVSVDGVMANDKVINGISIKQGGTGATRRISVCNTKVLGGAGVGVRLERVAGTLDGIIVDQTVDVLGVATPFQRIGTMNNVSLSPGAIKDTNFPISYDATVADDSVFSVPMQASAFTGFLMVSIGPAEYLIAVARAVSVAQITSVSKSSGVDVNTLVLTGTTGTDGKITVSSTAGAIYVENRSGTSQRISVTLMYGAK
ncbi:phage head-binding domain-containing protein [Leclercia sp. W17]|uniref:phage head-binding domain-containing protein n=2 Tax=Leclercia sp. W17 TaxID=2282309 RepID=UPI000DF2DC4D|nr:phage head-binding domain-containing protein [Leclercia sp. W17]AXF66059.1 hypothetical protein DVA44_19120 [Leclercia sp. W17]